MKTYTGKTVDDAVSKACLDLGVTIDQLNYEVTLETKGLFSKKAEIACWTVEMVQEYIENLIRKILTDMQFEVETVRSFSPHLPSDSHSLHNLLQFYKSFSY